MDYLLGEAQLAGCRGERRPASSGFGALGFGCRWLLPNVGGRGCTMQGTWGLQAAAPAPCSAAGAACRWLCASQSTEKYFTMFAGLLSDL